MELFECDPAAVKCIPSQVGHLSPSAAGSHSNLEKNCIPIITM